MGIGIGIGIGVGKGSRVAAPSPAPTPSQPLVDFDPGTGFATITWTEEGVTPTEERVEVYRSSDGGATYTLDDVYETASPTIPQPCVLDLGGLVGPGYLLAVRIRAFNGAAEGVSVDSEPFQVDSPLPTNVIAAGGVGTAELSWGPPTRNGWLTILINRQGGTDGSGTTVFSSSTPNDSTASLDDSSGFPDDAEQHRYHVIYDFGGGVGGDVFSNYIP